MTENLTTYTESDALNRLTETASRVTWTDMDRGDDQIYLYKDKGVDFFDEDFMHFFTVKQTGDSRTFDGGVVGAWGVTNNLNDMLGIVGANQDAFFLIFSNPSGDRRQLKIWQINGGSSSFSSAFDITEGVPYYIIMYRNDSFTTYGKIYAYIYSDAARTILLDTLSITIQSSKKDFRYIQLATSYDLTTDTVTGYTEDVDLPPNALGAVTTQDVTDFDGTTATGNGNITDRGIPYPKAYGVCWNTAGTPTTADDKTNEGSTYLTGAFTTDMTGLTPDQLYYVRAYVTNNVGTSYGSQVSFVADAPAIIAYRILDVTIDIVPYVDLKNGHDAVVTLNLIKGRFNPDAVAATQDPTVASILKRYKKK